MWHARKGVKLRYNESHAQKHYKLNVITKTAFTLKNGLNLQVAYALLKDF